MDLILLEGSGRAADGLVSLLKGTPPKDPGSVDLAARAKKDGLTRGPSGLRDALAAALKAPR